MAEQTCPSCGRPLPQELGQHSLTPASGLVECPHCGANVTLDGPATTGAAGGDSEGGESESTGADYFAGEETVEGVMEEIEQKEES